MNTPDFLQLIGANLASAFEFKQDGFAWLALLAACLGTYICRAIGVALSGRVDQESEFFRWLSAVTYAMVACLTIRLIFMPVGLLSTVPIYLRALICLICLAIMISSPHKRLVPALLTGTVLITLVGIMK